MRDYALSATAQELQVSQSSIERLPALDGLRGLAAVVVVSHHALLVVPALARPYYEPGAQSTGIAWWLVHSPLHLAWAGQEAVYLFFVLSGVVLARFASTSEFSWSGYFPSRIFRLYAPVVVAVVFAWITFMVVPRSGESQSLWVAARPETYSVSAILQDLTLIDGTSRSVSTLWSLQWEVLFSLLLPVSIYLAARTSVWWQLSAALTLLTVGLFVGSPVITYLPMFAVGVTVGTHWEYFSKLRVCLAQPVRSFWLGTGMLLGSFVLIGSYWTLVLFNDPRYAKLMSMPLTVIGALMMVLLAVNWDPLRRILENPVFLFLGTISFSLYLVHEPVVIAVAFLLGNNAHASAVGFGVSFIVSLLFYYCVERWTHKWARRIRARAS